MDPSPSMGASAQELQWEVDETERVLRDAQEKAERPEQEEEENQIVSVAAPNPLQQLQQMDQTASELLLSKDIAKWLEESSQTESAEDGEEGIFIEAERCIKLGQLLRQHPSRNNRNNNPLYHNLYHDEFQPTHEYLTNALVLQLRKGIRNINYPSLEACASLFKELEESQRLNASFQTVSRAAEWLYRIQQERDLLSAHVQGTSVAPSEEVDVVVRELCRPFVERVRHHFVVTPLQEQQQSNNNPQKSDRIECLPEWLFAFLKKHIFSTDGPFDVIHYGLAPLVRRDLSNDFCNEIVQLIQWVFAQRSLFRHAKLVGPHSQPLLLCNVIEQFLQFDDFLAQLTGNQAGRVLSLMDIYVAGDDELLQWWMERERESVFDTLFHGAILEKRNETGWNTNRVSPRAELFCSLLRSIKRKATVFSFSGPYLNQVAAPLAMEFLDAIHGTATDLKDLLFNQRRLPTATQLRSSLKEWIELINGTHMSAQLLLTEEEIFEEKEEEQQPRAGAPRSNAHQELLRLGKALERLEQVFVEEFSSLFVENILLEKAKMASYLMRASHMLASEADESVLDELSHDLADTQYVLNTFLEVVDEDRVFASSAHGPETVFYASRAIRDRVVTVVSQKFLEVALDWDGMTPSINFSGAQAFSKDVRLLFGESLLPPEAMRLLDVITCLCMDPAQLGIVADALCGLAGQSPPLSEDLFAVDERVYEEALSMLRAKNLVFLQLGDFLSVLNRRAEMTL